MNIPKIEEVFSSKGKVRILKVLANSDGLTITQLVTKARMNNATVRQHLEYFEEIGALEIRKVNERTNLYWLSQDRIGRVIDHVITYWDRWRRGSI